MGAVSQGGTASWGSDDRVDTGRTLASTSLPCGAAPRRPEAPLPPRGLVTQPGGPPVAMSDNAVFVYPPTITRAQARARAARLEPRASDDGRELACAAH